MSDISQKSKIKWLIEGDENNSYFHGIINKWRRHMAVRGMKMEGEWISNPELVKKNLSHFQEKFNAIEVVSRSPRFGHLLRKKLLILNLWRRSRNLKMRFGLVATINLLTQMDLLFLSLKNIGSSIKRNKKDDASNNWFWKGWWYSELEFSWQYDVVFEFWSSLEILD